MVRKVNPNRLKMKVPFYDYKRHYLNYASETIRVMQACMAGGAFILQPPLESFEDKMAHYIGVHNAVGVNSGTDAIYFALRGLGVGEGDTVVTTAHTFVATVAAIVRCGAKPYLVDIGEDMNMNMEQVEAVQDEAKAIIVVHLNGRMCEVGSGIDTNKVVEDAAQALGAEYMGANAGSSAIGAVACFSFYPAKLLGCMGDGGMLVTHDEGIARTARLLRDHGQNRETGDIECYGENSRLDTIQAAVLESRLKYVNEWIGTRRLLASIYQLAFREIGQIKLPPPLDDETHYDVYTNFVIRVPDRDALCYYLDEHEVGYLVSWPKPMHKHPALGLESFELPETEKASREVLSLPMNQYLRAEEVEHVIKTIKEFYQ